MCKSVPVAFFITTIKIMPQKGQLQKLTLSFYLAFIQSISISCVITQPDSATMPLQHAITEYAHAPLPSLCPE